jgi:Tfp pilus assembly protein PilF
MRGPGRRILILAVAACCAGCAGEEAAKKKKMPPEQEYALVVGTAQSLLNAGRVTEAIKAVDAALEKRPNDPALHYFRGQISFRTARYAEAEASFKRALALDPYFTDAHNFLGAVYRELGRTAEAEREYQLALSNPTYPTPEKVYLNLGLLYADQGRKGEALDALRRAVEINPKYYQGHFELAGVLDGMGELSEAAREYEVAEPGYRNTGDYYYRLGLTYMRLGDRDKAKENLARVLDIAPGTESAAQAGQLLETMD